MSLDPEADAIRAETVGEPLTFTDAERAAAAARLSDCTAQLTPGAAIAVTPTD
jgi:hypothetical protein